MKIVSKQTLQNLIRHQLLEHYTKKINLLTENENVYADNNVFGFAVYGCTRESLANYKSNPGHNLGPGQMKIEFKNGVKNNKEIQFIYNLEIKSP